MVSLKRFQIRFDRSKSNPCHPSCVNLIHQIRLADVRQAELIAKKILADASTSIESG